MRAKQVQKNTSRKIMNENTSLEKTGIHFVYVKNTVVIDSTLEWIILPSFWEKPLIDLAFRQTR